MPRRNFLLVLSYDGTDFSGWQRLPGAGRSVQEEVESALGRLLGAPVEVTGAGRTDAGVHAEGQAASFHAHTPLGPEEIVAGLGRELPADVRCRSCREVDPRFHARFRAKGKRYRYRLQVGPVADAAARRTSLRVEGRLDLELMREAAGILAGERDFRAFTNAKGKSDTRRRLDRVEVLESGFFLDLVFDGEGFLYNQVRLMAAAILAVGQGRLGLDRLVAALERGDRSALPGALGAFGLSLLEVRY
ncbi:MAG: tRNA pseudouridine(38-40) synthase TruA [Spirochaetaceae bacterium]|nr:tRNA pseudouridine(38-40) synthase TruA [Spirochaetaceae bacterium]